jgi:hypothetical protein
MTELPDAHHQTFSEITISLAQRDCVLTHTKRVETLQITDSKRLIFTFILTRKDLHSEIPTVYFPMFIIQEFGYFQYDA